MPSIHYFQRKRRDGKNFSLEQIFEELRIRFSSQYDVVKVEAPYISSGVFKRLINIFHAIFNQGDVNHITGDINYVNLLLTRRKNILTILDCAILHRTTGVRKMVLQFVWFKLPVWKSRFVTVISESTKDDLVEKTNVDPSKIEVIYVPISPDFKFSKKNFNSKKPRILQVGAAPNKNLSRLITAVRSIDCVLVIIGQISEENLIRLNERNIVYENYVGVPFGTIIEEYQKCDLLFFASTFEGFGMPILEAQATGRPVITSNILSMPEVGGDAAHYVNPFKVEEITEGILKIKNDEKYRLGMVKRGLENVHRFNAETIAAQYEKLYTSILQD